MANQDIKRVNNTELNMGEETKPQYAIKLVADISPVESLINDLEQIINSLSDSDSARLSQRLSELIKKDDIINTVSRVDIQQSITLLAYPSDEFLALYKEAKKRPQETRQLNTSKAATISDAKRLSDELNKPY